MMSTAKQLVKQVTHSKPQKGLGAAAHCGRLTSVTCAAQAAYNNFSDIQRAEADRFERFVEALADDVTFSPGLLASCSKTAFGKELHAALGTAGSAITTLATSTDLDAVEKLVDETRTFCTNVIALLENSLVDVLQAIRAQFGSRLVELLPIRQIRATGRVGGHSESPTPEAVAWGVLLVVQLATRELDTMSAAAQEALAKVAQSLQSQCKSSKRAERAAGQIHDGRQQILLLCGTATNLALHMREELVTILKVVAAQGRPPH